jgi:predicted extracellular nuclease
MKRNLLLRLAVLAVALTGAFTAPAQVISQVFGGGGNTGAPYNADYVELFNPTAAAVSVNGWSLQYTSSSGTSWAGKFNLPNASIPAGGYYLVRMSATGATGAALTADATSGAINMSAANGKVILANSTATLTAVACPTDASIVDFVFYASATCTANSAVLSNTTAAIRASAGCGTTFAVAAPTPRNSSTPTSPCSGPTNPSGTGTASPSSVSAGASSTLSANVTAGTNPASTGLAVTCNLTGVGGDAAFSLPLASGTTYSAAYTVPGATAAAGYALPCSISDSQSRNGSFNIALTVTGNASNPTATGSASPNPVTAGSSTTLNFAGVSGTNPTDNNLTAACNLTPIGGGSSVALPVVYSVPPATTPSTYSLSCTVTDGVPRSSTFSISVTVQAPPPTTRLIYEINGSGTASPLAGTSVTTRGVVTALRGTTGATKGFYIESVTADRDADPNTSEGLLVFTGSTALPACAVVGNSVSIQGTVSDFVPSTAPVGSVPLTELSATSNCTVLGTASLPAAVTIDNTNITAAGSATQARKFLGMRVLMANTTVVGPTTGNLDEPSAQATVANNFWVTAQGISRPFHQQNGIQATRRPSDAAASVPSWSGNPEAIEIDTTGLTGGGTFELPVGSTVAGISGIVDYDTSGGQYQIYTNAAGITGAVANGLSATPLPTPLATDLVLVDANIERFYDTISNGGDVVLTSTAYQGRLNKLSLAVRNVMKMPHIIALEEVEGPASGTAFPVLQDIVNKINADASAASQGSPNYGFCGGVTNDVGKISPAVIYRQDRITSLECSQYGISTIYTLPFTTTPTTNTLNDRPPVVFRGRATAPGSDSSFDIRVVVNHLRSLNGIDAPGTATGDRVRTKRNEQAKYLANLITGNVDQSTNWNLTDNLLVAGDMNAFDVNDGYSDSVNCIAGSPAPASQIYTTVAQNNASAPCTAVATLALTNLTTTDVAQRYSYSFSGIAQRIDHVLVNSKLSQRVRLTTYTRNNADFPEGPTYRNDFTRPERYSDHDAPAVYIKLPVEVTSRVRVNASALALNRATGRQNGTITVTNTGTAALTGPVYVFFNGLPAGVTLPDLPTSNGVPYATVNLPSGLAPGATSGTAAISFANPSNVRVSYTTKSFDTNF